MKKCRILFVCLGNICRSPLAEVVCRHLIAERGLESKFEVDSCGTGHWHVGERAHPDSARVAKKDGISLADHRARQLHRVDFDQFGLLVAMDRSNLRDMQDFGVDAEERMFCLREYDPMKGSKAKDLDVPDPYYEGGFEGVYDIIYRSCSALLDHLAEEV